MTSIKFRALTNNDYKLFFEALGEHGKDFQNIQQYMAQKCAKGNSSKSSDQNKSIDPQEKREQDKKEEDKKRDQIRNFYNKLYAKLSQLIGKLDDRVEKVIQELYLLINYGEIWKKHGFKFNNKTKKLLEELVHQGYTTLRFKNKNVRLRTPPCKALKKINEIGIDEKVKVVTSRELPKDVIVEFHPSTNRDWLKVQSMAQNPLVRAKLSIQKRMFNILEFLENKWNISQDKLNRTVDAWLKVPINNQSLEETQTQVCPANTNVHNTSFNNGNFNSRIETQNADLSNVASEQNQANPIGDTHFRLRLKPSSKHELKEVNITRVVPDNHLDLSFNAYIKRFGESISKNCEQSTRNNANKDTSINSQGALEDGINNSDHNHDASQGAPSTGSRLPLSLTTPDSSILLEKSSTSDHPYNATAQKSINFLAKIVGSFGGCENSRTACEDTQDRSLQTPIQFNENSRSINNSARNVYLNHVESNKTSNVNSLVNNNISALLDEDATIEPVLPPSEAQSDQLSANVISKLNSDSQNSKSVDFNIPKNVLLGDWLKMSGHDDGDDANDAFPQNHGDNISDNNKDNVPTLSDSREDACETPANKADLYSNGNRLRPQNHMIEIKKLAEGWTRQDESSMTIGELYLAFKCPEKIVLEYEFEQFTYNNTHDQLKNDCPDKVPEKLDQFTGTTIVPENPLNNTLIFKLLTAASLSLAQIERQKQEQQHKLQEQPTAKLKRRKGPSNPNTIKYLKRDDASVNSCLTPSASGQQPEAHASTNNQVANNHLLYNNNYISTSNDKSQGQPMTLHDIETTNQRVEEALKQLQPTRLRVYRRAR